MKKILFSILSAFMVSTVASAQYLNVKLDDGTWRSYKPSSKTELSFGAKKGTDPTDFEQMVTVGGHTVAVKLADDIPASDVAFSTNVKGDKVEIKAISITNKELMCTWDGNEEIHGPDVSNGFYTFTISDISKDVVATVKYYYTCIVKFDMKGRGDAIKDAKVELGKTVTAPSTTPTAENYAFWCWCTDAECTTPYDFSKSVTADMTLYAKWTEGINGHAYVELAGYKWATENVGYCKNVGAVAGPETTNNGWGFYFYKLESNDALNAAQSWGSETDAKQVTHSWTLPSESQWKALIENCYWEWTDSYNYPTSPYNGKPGYIVYYAKSDDDKNQLNKENSGYTPATVPHLFLPAAGFYDNGLGFVDQSRVGYYWSSDISRFLKFYYEERLMGTEYWGSGLSVRPLAK